MQSSIVARTCTSTNDEITSRGMPMWFDSWSDILDVIVSGVVCYAGIVVWLRIGGKRTLAKWNGFDFVITVALGSVFASLLLIESVSIAEGLTGFGLLILMQMSVTWLSSRFRWADRLLKSEPVLLFRDGEFLDEALRTERVSNSEVRAAIRAASINCLQEVHAVILETDGSFSVFESAATGSRSALTDVRGYSSGVSTRRPRLP